MIRYGLEREFFVLNKDGVNVVCPNDLPTDECGFLAEARGKPHVDIVEAIFSLKADTHRVFEIAKKHNLTLTATPIMRVSRQLKLEAGRRFQKGLISYQNIYGHRPDQKIQKGKS